MPRLRTEINTEAMEKRVRHAARAVLRVGLAYLDADFEHGQWWITNRNTGAQYSVCDAEGTSPDIADGFCFEQVTRGEEE